jgi:hypothetical protein
MNVRMLWLGCAQSLFALTLAGCCCEQAPHRGGCGRLAGHRPLLHFEQVCPYGFPPYNSAPLGYANGFLNTVEVSSTRHVLMAPSIAQPSPTKAPATLPPVADENVKPLPADAAEQTPIAKDPPKVAPQQTPIIVPKVETPVVETPDVKTPNAIVQPRHAPRTTEPELKVDANLEEAPSPNTTEQPVSVPTPDANTGDDDLPENPLEQNVAPPPAVEPTVPDAPAPKSDATEDDEGDATEDADGDVWPDAPLPKNDLPPLAGPI